MPLLEASHERLSGVYIECLPWQNFIQKWDRPHALFFIDPPYWGVEDYYVKAMFAREEFEHLSTSLKQLKGNFILTLNDVPEIRNIFAWANMQSVNLNYFTGGKPTSAREIIITGGAG